MPWVWVGRFCFDLSRVELVERAVGPDGGVTITLLNGKEVDLVGPDADAFLRAWGEHTSPRSVERGPPVSKVLTPVQIRPANSEARTDLSVHPHG